MRLRDLRTKRIPRPPRNLRQGILANGRAVASWPAWDGRLGQHSDGNCSLAGVVIGGTWLQEAENGRSSMKCFRWLPHASCISLTTIYARANHTPFARETRWPVPITTQRLLNPDTRMSRTFDLSWWQHVFVNKLHGSGVHGSHQDSITWSSESQNLGRSEIRGDIQGSTNLLAHSRWMCIAQHFGRARLAALAKVYRCASYPGLWIDH